MPKRIIHCLLIVFLCSLPLLFWVGCTNKKSGKPKTQWYESKAWRKKTIQQAKRGDVHARCLLDMYHPGWEERDECYLAQPVIERGTRDAAEQGNAEAQFQRGQRYLLGYHRDGSFHPSDRDEGKRWLRKAAEQGHKEAIELLEMDLKQSGTAQPIRR